MDKVRGSEPVVVPGMLVGNTDTLHYQNLTNKIYRFTPVVLDGEEDINRIHGVDERVSVRGFSQVKTVSHASKTRWRTYKSYFGSALILFRKTQILKKG